jgi:hypothetical protein
MAMFRGVSADYYHQSPKYDGKGCEREKNPTPNLTIHTKSLLNSVAIAEVSILLGLHVFILV